MSDSTPLPLNPDHHDDDGSVGTMVRPSVRPTRPRLDKLPPWKVLLHNDDHNAMEYVVLAIVELTPLKEFEAIRRMFEAHTRGLTLLLTTHKERAELYKEQFTAKGLTVTIEPA